MRIILIIFSFFFCISSYVLAQEASQYAKKVSDSNRNRLKEQQAIEPSNTSNKANVLIDDNNRKILNSKGSGIRVNEKIFRARQEYDVSPKNIKSVSGNTSFGIVNISSSKPRALVREPAPIHKQQ